MDSYFRYLPPLINLQFYKKKTKVMQIAGLEKTLMFDMEGTFLGEVRLCLNVNSQNLE